MDIKIVYEDKDVLVCEKPAGIPVQSARIGTKDMVSILKNYRSEKEGIKGDPYVGLVHRLDQPVHGLLVFGKHKGAAGDLSRQVSDGRMKKQYQAVVCGKPEKKEGVLVDHLQKDGRTNTSKIVPKGTKDAKEARLSYRVLKELGEEALVEIDLETGRHHQIRVQMAGAGMPLAGDQKYNPASVGRTYPALSACRLSFVHPGTKKRMEFQCTPAGAYFEKFR